MNIFVGNLNYKVKENELKDIFEEYGEVASVKIIVDKYTNRSKGYGFVEMNNDNEAQIAIEELNGVELEGRQMSVNVARPRKQDDNRD